MTPVTEGTGVLVVEHYGEGREDGEGTNGDDGATRGVSGGMGAAGR